MAARPMPAMTMANADAPRPPDEPPVPVRGSAATGAMLPAGRVAVAVAAGCVAVLVAVDVGVHVGVAEAVRVAAGVIGVDVGVFVGVSVGVFVGVFVTLTVGVFVGVFVGEFVGTPAGVLVGILVGVSVGVFVGVAVDVLVATGVFVGVRPVQSASATPDVPGSAIHAAAAIDKASAMFSTFVMSAILQNLVARGGARISNRLILASWDRIRHEDLY